MICAQVAWSTFFGGNATGILTDSLQVAGAALEADLGRTRFLLKAVSNGVDAAKRALASASTRLVVGPAGAGARQRPFCDDRRVRRERLARIGRSTQVNTCASSRRRCSTASSTGKEGGSRCSRTSS